MSKRNVELRTARNQVRETLLGSFGSNGGVGDAQEDVHPETRHSGEATKRRDSPSPGDAARRRDSPSGHLPRRSSDEAEPLSGNQPSLRWDDVGVGMGGWGGGWGGGDGKEELESLDFDTVNSAYWADKCRRQPRTLKGFLETLTGSKFFYRWVLTVVIGVGLALSAQIMQLLIGALTGMRNNMLQSFSDTDTHPSKSFAFYALYNLCLVSVAAIVTAYLEPVAAGDGIADIKAYLNGTHVTNIFRIRTVLTRLFGSILTVSSGLACGPEGPMIHIGAGIASGVTRADKLFSFLDLSPTILSRFQNDRDRREFICAGAGAGMAAAFGAPVGGVLFALEEAASHWSPQLIWRIFTAAITATFTLALAKARGNRGDISLTGLLSFGTTQSVYNMKRDIISEDGAAPVSAVDAPIYWWELVFFFPLLGAVGGVLGGISGIIFDKMYVLRHKRPVLQVLEAMLVSLITSGAVFSLVISKPMCRHNGSWTCTHAENWGDWCGGRHDNSTCVGPLSSCVEAAAWVCVGGQNSGHPCRGKGDCEWRGGKCTAVLADEVFGVRMRCPEGQYDELATIFFGLREPVIVRMVAQAHPHEPFSNSALLLSTVVIYALMLLTYGTAIPMGLFMPCCLIGASFGRFFGQVIKSWLGAYALAGAAAMLGGVQRATISLVVILIEGTANEHFLLPIVTATLCANFVGNTITREGVFDISLRRKKLRFLPHEPDWLMQLCTSGDVMSHPPRCLCTLETIGNIVDLLKDCSHHGFPVLSTEQSTHWGVDGADQDPPTAPKQRQGESSVSPAGRFEGVISRQSLRYILGMRFAGPEGGGRVWHAITAERPEDVPLDGDPVLYELIEYRRRKADTTSVQKEWEWAAFSNDDRARYVNIGCYMNAASCTVLESCPVSRAYRMFRSMGLRHLPVVDVENRVVGMVTRASFSKQTMHRTANAFYRQQDLYMPENEGPITARLHARDQVSRIRARENLSCSNASFRIGGTYRSWQTRLIDSLQAEGSRRMESASEDVPSPSLRCSVNRNEDEEGDHALSSEDIEPFIE